MKDSKIKNIAQELFSTCYLVEKEIVGHSDEVSKRWAKANSIRHAYTILAIDNYLKNTHKDALKISNIELLNASGLACGHQDFSICEYFLKRYSIEWTVFESPRSPYLDKKKFKELVEKFSIKIELSDFSSTDNPYGMGQYNIILFTEIIEHLDHSTLLNSLKSIRNRLKDKGILILTTPNLARLENRIKLLFGNGDLGYWGDGCENLKKGLWGHIAYYDAHRLDRILRDTGFCCVQYYSFNHRGPELNLFLKIIKKIIDFTSLFVKNSKQNIFTAKKSDIKKIPFQI